MWKNNNNNDNFKTKHNNLLNNVGDQKDKYSFRRDLVNTDLHRQAGHTKT